MIFPHIHFWFTVSSLHLISIKPPSNKSARQLRDRVLSGAMRSGTSRSGTQSSHLLPQPMKCTLTSYPPERAVPVRVGDAPGTGCAGRISVTYDSNHDFSRSIASIR